MKERDIIEGNKLIAKFIGGVTKDINSNNRGIAWISAHMDDDEINFNEEDYPETPHDGSCWKFNELRYHSSWDWLMPVVEKIEEIGETSKRYGTLCTIDTNHIRIGKITLDHKVKDYSTKIEGTWLAAVEFIKDYNLNNKT